MLAYTVRHPVLVLNYAVSRTIGEIDTEDAQAPRYTVPGNFLSALYENPQQRSPEDSLTSEAAFSVKRKRKKEKERGREKETEREREKERERERERDREREKQRRERETEK